MTMTTVRDFLYKDVNWKLVEEYARNESINLVLK